MAENDSTPYANGVRITDKDLRIVVLGIENKFSEILSELKSIQKSQDEQSRRFDTLEKKVEDNAEDIRTGRQRIHDLANTVQGIQLRTAPLTTDISTQLAASAHTLRRGVELLESTDAHFMLNQADIDWIRTTQKKVTDDDIRFLAEKRKAEAQKQQEFFGLRREVFYSIIGVVALVIASAVLSPLVMHLLYGKPF